MHNLTIILEDLRKNKILEIKRWKEIKKGINSRILKVLDQNNACYAIKIYPEPNSYDKRQRLHHEKAFLDHLTKNKIHNTPKIKHVNFELNYCLMNWIDGKSMTSLSGQHIKEISLFISKINACSRQDIAHLPYASESLKCPKKFAESINLRFKNLYAINPTSKIGREVKAWLGKNLSSYMKKLLTILEDNIVDNAWLTDERCTYISPSDVGIHNTLSVKNSLYFLDFEYAGIDDLSKLAADWILQPNYPFSKEEEENFLSSLETEFSHKRDDWKRRYEMIKDLTVVKWILIMLRAHMDDNINAAQWGKIQIYVNFHGLYI